MMYVYLYLYVCFNVFSIQFNCFCFIDINIYQPNTIPFLLMYEQCNNNCLWQYTVYWIQMLQVKLVC